MGCQARTERVKVLFKDDRTQDFKQCTFTSQIILLTKHVNGRKAKTKRKNKIAYSYNSNNYFPENTKTPK